MHPSKAELVRDLHAELFPEDWDLVYDSGTDIKDRKKGINPLQSEYVALHDCKRARLGLPPVDPSNIPTVAVREWLENQLKSSTKDQVREIVESAIEKCRS